MENFNPNELNLNALHPREVQQIFNLKLDLDSISNESLTAYLTNNAVSYFDGFKKVFILKNCCIFLNGLKDKYRHNHDWVVEDSMLKRDNVSPNKVIEGFYRDYADADDERILKILLTQVVPWMCSDNLKETESI